MNVPPPESAHGRARRQEPAMNVMPIPTTVAAPGARNLP